MFLAIQLRDLRRIKENISSMREHAELLSSVRDDISEKHVTTNAAAMRKSNNSWKHISFLGSQRMMFGAIGGKAKILSEKMNQKEAIKRYTYPLSRDCSMYVVHNHLLACKVTKFEHRGCFWYLAWNGSLIAFLFFLPCVTNLQHTTF
ncbi:hypothetical protein V2J09_013801 [Rumex salicifolius]